MSMLQEAVLAFTAQDRKSTAASFIMSGVLILGLVLLSLGVPDEGGRLNVLRVVVALVAVGEFLGALGQGLFTRALFERQGRPDHPLHRGAIQDFSFYNLAMAVGLVFAAFDPIKSSVVINVYILLSCIHGGAHLLRCTRISATDRGAEIRQGLPLIVVTLALILFHP